MKKLLASFCTLFIVLSSFSQTNRDWCYFYGGNSDELIFDMCADDHGYLYVAGYTNSDTLIAKNGFQNTRAGGADAFLMKLDTTGYVMWATYYGGTGGDIGTSLAIDKDGYVYMAGYTSSTTGIADGGFQNTYAGGAYDDFVVKFDTSGNRVWATYYGGPGDEANSFGGMNCDITTDTSGNVYLAGNTSSTTGIAFNGYQNTYGGSAADDAFLVKFDSLGTRLWATYYGWIGYTEAYSVATDSKNNVIIAGRTTNSSSSMTHNGHQNNFVGNVDGILVKFNSAGSRLWASFYGGSNYTLINDVTVDSKDNIIIAGQSASTNNVASWNAYEFSYQGGGSDAFLAKFDTSGVRLWGTYFGGTDYDYALSIDIDKNDFIYMAGDSYSTNNIGFGGFQDTLGGLENQFIAKYDTSGYRYCSTYYSQGHSEEGFVVINKFDQIFLSGSTADLPGVSTLTPNSGYGGGPYDPYVGKFSSCDLFVGLDEVVPNKIEFELFPNPNNGIFTLAHDIDLSQGIAELTLFDIMGKIQAVKVLNEPSVELSLNIPSGVYFYRLAYNGEMIGNGKMIVR